MDFPRKDVKKIQQEIAHLVRQKAEEGGKSKWTEWCLKVMQELKAIREAK